jgi:N-acetylglucosaminyldiphosphoundecaprenol N-acetyl-beta-D-mannosaminyltransferase
MIDVVVRAIPRFFKVLGVRIDAVQIPDVVKQTEQWISLGDGTHFVSVTNVHVVIETQHDASFRNVMDSADLVVPDGMPLVWLGRLQGYQLRHRVYGPDLLLAFCGETQNKGYSHFFYGGAPGVADGLAKALERRFPSLRVVGTYSPPFRPLTEEEDAEVIRTINQAAPDVLWVGLGCPKQELWMYEHRNKLAVPVMFGVGQAFDIAANCKRQAPRWMREHGLEWFFRLCQDPRRLWRRYLFYNAQFIYYTWMEFLGLREFH